MREQETREKIAKIIAKNLCKNKHSHFQLYGDSANCYSRENFAECEVITDTVDALIEAGIGDVSELQKECDSKEEAYNKCYSDYKYWKDKAKEYKQHYNDLEQRFKSKEKQYNELVLSSCEALDKKSKVIDEYKHRAEVAERALEILDDYECLSNSIRYYMKQAEKELAKGDKQ